MRGRKGTCSWFSSRTTSHCLRFGQLWYVLQCTIFPQTVAVGYLFQTDQIHGLIQAGLLIMLGLLLSHPRSKLPKSATQVCQSAHQ